MQIRQLNIARYRGVEALSWEPAPGWNCIIGPGDSLKTTVLSAIGLLLAPHALGPRSEYEYYQRDVASEFEIEAVIGALDLNTIATSSIAAAPWGLHEGKLVAICGKNDEPVIRVRVRGTSELEAIHELVLPSGDVATFPITLRKSLGLVQLREEAAFGRTFGLSTGSALSRHVDNEGMRNAVYAAISASATTLSVPKVATDTITALQTEFAEAGLPTNLLLGLMPVQSGDILTIVALHSGIDPGKAIPLSRFGTGTRELAALVMAMRAAGDSTILTIDELEKGLEPYRQRLVCDRLKELAGDNGQIISTTHSPAVILKVIEHGGALWFWHSGSATRLSSEPLLKLLKTDPGALFSPYVIVCEGPTEIGLASAVLPQELLDKSGVHFIDGRGQPQAFKLINALSDLGIAVGAFLDNEDVCSGTRDALGCKLFAWREVRNIEEALAKWLPIDKLGELLKVAAEATGIDERYLVTQINDEVPTAQKQALSTHDWATISTAYSEDTLRAALTAAMLRKDGAWFKSAERGRLLGQFLVSFSLPAEIECQFKAMREALFSQAKSENAHEESP